jgi:hypothetical protein
LIAPGLIAVAAEIENAPPEAGAPTLIVKFPPPVLLNETLPSAAAVTDPIPVLPCVTTYVPSASPVTICFTVPEALNVYDAEVCGVAPFVGNIAT